MKASHQTIAALVIALASGTGGFFLGKSQPAAPSVTTTASRPQASRAEDQRAVASRPVAPSVDIKELRAELDREKNPLARFQLALKNLEGWVARDPEDALAWLTTQQASDRRDDVIRTALGQYSENDAKGAAEWAMKNLSGAELNNTIIAIAENWAQQNGEEAATWFIARPDSPERDAAIENIFFNWAANEPSASLDFLKAHPELADQASALRRAALAGWAKSDPLGAVAKSLTLSQENGDPDQFANTVANWATMDLDASSQWLVTNLPPGTERSAAAQELANIFAQQSPDSGLVWLEKLDPGSERDAAASALVASWSRISPEETAKWAMSQSISTLTPEAMGIIAQNYFMKNPDGFKVWKAALPAGNMKDAAADAGTVGDDE